MRGRRAKRTQPTTQGTADAEGAGSDVEMAVDGEEEKEVDDVAPARRRLGRSRKQPRRPSRASKQPTRSKATFSTPELDGEEEEEEAEEEGGEAEAEEEVEEEKKENEEKKGTPAPDDDQAQASAATAPATPATEIQATPGQETRTVGGKTYRLEKDELVLPDNPVGEMKIDKHGRLLGGRQYKESTFTSPVRDDPERLYMLSIDAARCTGHRDSLYFFRKNPLLVKLTLWQSEKQQLIDDGKLSVNLKSRSVTAVAVRNVFKLMGAKIVANGKYIVDDYDEERSRQEGHKEGEPVGEIAENLEYLREKQSQAQASLPRERGALGPSLPPSGRSRTYHSSLGDGVTVFGGPGLAPFTAAGTHAMKRAALARAELTPRNWMHKFAQQVSEANSAMRAFRRERLVAFHTVMGQEGEEEIADETDQVEDEDDKPPWETEGDKEEAEEGTPAFGPGIAERRADGAAKGVDSPATPLDSAAGTPRPILHVRKKSPDGDRPSAKKRKRELEPPLGLYEPHTHTPHFRTDSQPTAARIEKVAAWPEIPLQIQDERAEGGKGDRSEEMKKPQRTNVPLLGGTKVGGGAWGVASWSTQMMYPGR